jgi:hypothetical protein
MSILELIRRVLVSLRPRWELFSDRPVVGVRPRPRWEIFPDRLVVGIRPRPKWWPYLVRPRPRWWPYLACLFLWRPPRYEPHRWNDNGFIRWNNNCYNYACDIQTDTFAQPGLASGNKYDSLHCSEVANGALSDGLRAGSDAAACGPLCHKVALVVAPGDDYHWYRLDENGMWSHKPGHTEATNLDHLDRPITDPRNADRGPYKDFCGFFCRRCGEVDIR